MTWNGAMSKGHRCVGPRAQIQCSSFPVMGSTTVIGRRYKDKSRQGEILKRELE